MNQPSGQFNEAQATGAQGTGAKPAAPQADAPYAIRPQETQDWLNRRIYHPLSYLLARLLLPTGVTPNMVSFLGLLDVWLVAYCYVGMGWQHAVILGFALHLFWHVLDGADGDLARMSGRSSPIGELVDGVCDYFGHIVLYLALGYLMMAEIGWLAWVVVVVSGAARIVQANHAESQKRVYLWWAHDKSWLANDKPKRGADRDKGLFSAIFGGLVEPYLKLASSMAPRSARVDQLTRNIGDGGRNRERLRRLILANPKWQLNLQSMLGANFRTVALGISMLLGTPLWFFLTEIVLLSIILVISVQHHRIVSQKIVTALERGLKPRT